MLSLHWMLMGDCRVPPGTETGPVQSGCTAGREKETLSEASASSCVLDGQGRNPAARDPTGLGSRETGTWGPLGSWTCAHRVFAFSSLFRTTWGLSFPPGSNSLSACAACVDGFLTSVLLSSQSGQEKYGETLGRAGGRRRALSGRQAECCGALVSPEGFETSLPPHRNPT